ncbi:phytolongin Phyl1.1-like [Silene latifolia]|uniref:phytolongin Phyl1.1-like n=1 Tax=Silene latifolia TaxID=37657 RepID=UPI003D778BB9
MGSMEKGFVHYCCVAKGGRILQSYNDGNGDSNENPEIEKLAALCLEKVPQFHRWYSQTMNKRSYCYLMEDGLVYFAIAEEGLGNQAVIRFLEHYRDEFKKIVKRDSGFRLSWKAKGKGSRSSSNLNSVNLQEQLIPVIKQLITSLENVSQASSDSTFNSSLSPCGSSTMAPLLGTKSGKLEKRSEDHVITMRGFEVEEQCQSSERGLTGTIVSPDPLSKEMNASRRRSSSQTVRRKWCRLVRLVLAIDAVVCIILLVVWLAICKGFQCIR